MAIILRAGAEDAGLSATDREAIPFIQRGLPNW